MKRTTRTTVPRVGALTAAPGLPDDNPFAAGSSEIGGARSRRPLEHHPRLPARRRRLHRPGAPLTLTQPGAGTSGTLAATKPAPDTKVPAGVSEEVPCTAGNGSIAND